MGDSAPSVCCVALTPALQRTVRFDRLTFGAVNRATDTTLTASGKGLNVAQALQSLACPAHVCAFLGGDTGRTIQAELSRIHIPFLYAETQADTRICQTLLDRATGEATELVEEAPLPTANEWTRFFAAYTESLRTSSLVVLAGAPMPGAPDTCYARLIEEAARHTIPVLIDTHGPPLQYALPYRPRIVKINRVEALATFPSPRQSDDPLLDAAHQMLDQGAQSVVITDGPHPCRLITPQHTLRFQPPAITPINPIGSGDAVNAGIAAALSQGQTLEDAVRLGIGSGAANALTPLPGTFDGATARRYADQLHPLP